MKRTARWIARGLTAAALGLSLSMPATAQEDPDLALLLKEAGERNPELSAARREAEAAASRVEPAAALDDPMLEAGLLNVPAQSLDLRQEDMTMKMIGISQRLPYPGKRALRRGAAQKDAEAAALGVQEVVNRVRRDVKTAYLDLWLADESLRLTESNLRVLEQFLSIAESRYAVGQSTQADVFKAQTQLSRMQQERIRLGRERPALEAELNRAVGRGDAASVTPRAPGLRETDLHLEALRASARASRPLLLAQQRAVERSAAQAEIARKDYYPDFDVRFSYGQRDNFQGMRREDLISLTVAINLPLWGEKKREPRVAEAESMRGQASSMVQARLNEIDSMLRQQVAAAGQALRSVRLYEGALIPQARLTSDASLSAYRVGRVDFFTLLDSRMTVFNAEIDRAASRVAYNKALAEIEFLTGAALSGDAP
jgi:cobalt-zinc-cadmium efflux system outer membrane protein